MHRKLNKPTFAQKLIRRINVALDRVCGYDFLTVIPVNELGLDERLVSKCSPSWSKLLANVFAELHITNADRILDVGCGKGAVMRGLIKFPFLRVDGIEISDKLAEIARDNFNKLKSSVKIFNVNAIDFIGYGDYNFIYFYNPFPAVIMELVMNNLSVQMSDVRCQMSDVRCQETIIIYNNPVCNKTVLNYGFFQIKEYPDEWGNGIFVYSNKSESNRIKAQGNN